MNENFARLGGDYLFSEIARAAADYESGGGREKLIRLGTGDVTLPLCPTVVSAMRVAVDETSRASGFRGYAPEGGYPFLREAVARDYAAYGVVVEAHEVYISDGSKSDAGNIVEVFGDVTACVPDPVYPVYADSNILAGRRIRYMRGGEDNGFLPAPDQCPEEGALIYLCSPNNPTGAAYDRDGLAAWVEHAHRTGSLILFDAAYRAFASRGLPRSIFEIDGARECAIEFCSLSKSAGFTGTRCAWTVIPRDLECAGGTLAAAWRRRQATKFNGVAYVVQRGAEAALSPRGVAECARQVACYKENAALRSRGVAVWGAGDSPYVWFKCPGTNDSREFFKSLLDRCGILGVPGAGFGGGGEGYFRFSAFAARADILEAVRRLEDRM